MKKLLIIIGSVLLSAAIALAIILPIVLSGGGNQEDSYRSIKALELQGESLCIRNEKEIQVYENMNFRNEDKIKTGNDSYLVLRLDSDKYIYVGSNSSIVLKSSEKDSSKTTIRVNEGSIVTEVKNKLTDLEEFGVETPNSTMAIRGTTFQVEVIKKDNEYEINYRLVEGLIDVNVLESKDNTITSGLFRMNPMEEIKIIAESDGIVDEANGLDDVINKINNNDTSIEVKSYDSVEEYISKTTKVTLHKKQLSLSDIASILEKIRFNHEQGMFRTIALNSTFNVYENETLKESDLVKYEADKEYEIIITAEEKENMEVNSWRVMAVNENGEFATRVISGSTTLQIRVTTSMVLEPLYESLTSKTLKILPSNGAMCIANNNNLTDELALGEGTITLKAQEQDDMIFMGWYEVDENGNATLIDDRNLELTDYNISERLDAGVVSIQPRYITKANASNMNSYVRKALNSSLVDENTTIHLKSGTNFNPEDYVVEVYDGIYKATLDLSEVQVSFENGGLAVDPVSNTVDDGDYSFVVSLLEDTPTQEIPLVIEPFTLTIHQPYVGTSITVEYYQEGVVGSQTTTLDNINNPSVVLENVTSYTLTFDIGSFTGLFAGFQDEYVSGSPKLISGSYTYTGTVNQKVDISTRVLPKYGQTSNDKIYLYVYDKEGNKLDEINMPFGKRFYMDDYVFKINYETYYPGELFEIPSDILMYSINDTNGNNNLSESSMATVTNKYSYKRYDFCFYAKDGAGTFIQTYRYLVVLPDADCFAVQLIDEPVKAYIDDTLVTSNNMLKYLIDGNVTLKAEKKEDYAFIGYVKIDKDGNATILSEEMEISINVKEMMTSGSYAIVPEYVEYYMLNLSDKNDSRIYKDDNYKIVSGSKLNKDDFTLTASGNGINVELHEYEFEVYDSSDNLVDPFTNVLPDGTYKIYVNVNGTEITKFKLEITSFKLTVYNESEYKFKVIVDGVEKELAANSNESYSGTVIKVSPKENENYFYGYYDYDTYDYSYELEYEITLEADKGIRPDFIDCFNGGSLNAGKISEEGYVESISKHRTPMGEEFEYASVLYISEYYGWRFIPERIMSVVEHSIYDTVLNKVLTEEEISVAFSTPSDGRYNAVYTITENLSCEVPIMVYNPQGVTINLVANPEASINIYYDTKDGEAQLTNITEDKTIEHVLSFELVCTLNDTGTSVFAGWYKFEDDEYQFLSKYTSLQMVPTENMTIHPLVVSNTAGTAGILLKNNVLVTSYQELYGREPAPFTFAFKETNDSLFIIDHSVLKNQDNYNYYQVCYNNSRYYEITRYDKSYTSGCFIIITFKNGSTEIDKKFTFTNTPEPDTFAPVTFIFGDSIDVDKVKYYDTVGGQSLTREMYKDDELVTTSEDIELDFHDSKYSMIIRINKNSAILNGNIVSFAIESEGYGIHGLATDNFSPKFYIVNTSTNKVESEITDLAHVQIDVTSQRVVAIAECIYSDSLNLNRNAEYRSFYRSGVYNMGMHRIVEFNIYIEE